MNQVVGTGTPCHPWFFFGTPTERCWWMTMLHFGTNNISALHNLILLGSVSSPIYPKQQGFFIAHLARKCRGRKRKKHRPRPRVSPKKPISKAAWRVFERLGATKIPIRRWSFCDADAGHIHGKKTWENNIKIILKFSFLQERKKSNKVLRPDAVFHGISTDRIFLPNPTGSTWARKTLRYLNHESSYSCLGFAGSENFIVFMIYTPEV